MKDVHISKFLSHSQKGIHIGIVDHPVATPDDIQVEDNVVRVWAIQSGGIFGRSALLKELWRYLKPEDIQTLGGIVGKLIKSLYPQAKLNISAYPDVHGENAHRIVAYLMDKVAHNLGTEKLVWIIGEYPLDEKNDLYNLLKDLSSIQSRYTHHIIAISYRPKMDFATSLKVDIPYTQRDIPRGKAGKTLRYLALLSYASYGYMRRSVAYKLISTYGLDKGYIKLRDMGFVVETNGYIKIPDRAIWKIAIEKASNEDLDNVIQFIEDIGSSASLYTLAHLHHLKGDDREMEYIRRYLIRSKEEGLPWQAQANIQPLFEKLKGKATVRDWKVLIDIASLSGEVSPLVREGINILLSSENLSPETAVNIAWLGKYLDEKTLSRLIGYIRKNIQKRDKNTETILAYALLGAYFALDVFSIRTIQETMLHIKTEEIQDTHLQIKALTTRSRIYLYFGKYTEGLRDILKAIDLALSSKGYMYLATLYNNLVYTLKQIGVENNIQLASLQKKALELSVIYGETYHILSALHNFITLQSDGGGRYKDLIEMVDTAEHIFSTTALDRLRLLLSRATLYLKYGYKDKADETFKEIENIIETLNIPRFLKSVYLLLRYQYHKERHEISYARYYLELYTRTSAEDDTVREMKKALDIMEHGGICTLDSHCTYYTASRSGKIEKGIEVIKDQINKDLEDSNLLEAAKDELYLAALYRLSGNPHIAKKHMILTHILSSYLGMAHMEDIEGTITPIEYSESTLQEILHLLLDRHAMHVVSHKGAGSVEEFLDSIFKYIPVPYFAGWIDLRIDGKIYQREHVLIKDMFWGFIKDPRAIAKMMSSYGISTSPSYIYVKIREGENSLAIYMENPLLEEAFQQKHLSVLSIWAENILTYAKKLSENGKLLSDPQTGLYTTWYIRHRLSKEFERMKREKRPLSVITLGIVKNIDISNMWESEIYREIGKLISENIRGVDIAGRLGADEFLIILPSTPGHEATLVAKRIIEKGRLLRRLGISIHAGIDCTDYPPRYKRSDSLISGSTLALRKAIATGEDIVVYKEYPL